MPDKSHYSVELSAFELRILQKMACGWEAKEIADWSDRKFRTIQHQQQQIYRKLGVTRAIEAIIVGLKRGHLKLDDIDAKMFRSRRSVLVSKQPWVSYTLSSRGLL